MNRLNIRLFYSTINETQIKELENLSGGALGTIT
jgi:hypothetical protein